MEHLKRVLSLVAELSASALRDETDMDSLGAMIQKYHTAMAELVVDEPDMEPLTKCTCGMLELLSNEREMVSLIEFTTPIKNQLMENGRVEIDPAPNQVELPNETNNNLIKGFVWLPNNHSTGHFACDLCTESGDGYFSFWPKAGKSEYFIGIHDAKKNAYTKDKKAEEGEPCVFSLYSLDKITMLQKLEEFNRGIENNSLKYEATVPLSWNGNGNRYTDVEMETHNCCTIIWNLLVAGGIQDLITKTIFQGCVHINPISALGDLNEAAGFPLPKMSMTANPWSMFNLLSMATYAERRKYNGLQSLVDDINN